MTENMVFAFPNYADADYYAPALSGGSWLAALPLSNLQDRLLSKKARSADAAAASTRLHADLKTLRAVRLLSLHGHNLGRSARVRFRATQQAAFSGVTLAAGALSNASSITVQCAGGTAMIRAGDTFLLNGATYRFTGDLAIGGNRFKNTEAAGAGFTTLNASAALDTGVEAPDGSSTATRITEDTATGNHGVYRGTASDSLPVGQQDEFSVFLKPDERTKVEYTLGVNNIRLGAYSFVTVIFDLTGDGAVDSTAVYGASLLQLDAATISARPDGWYRLRVAVTAGEANNVVSDALYLRSGGTSSYAGDGASGLYLWGPQRETKQAASIYKRSGATAASAVTSGSVNISPNLAGAANAGDALTCLCGEYVSTTPALDSGWEEPWPVIYDWYLPWEHPSFWDGRITEEERSGYPKNYHYLHGSAVTARYALVEIDDASNADGYVELGRLFISGAVQPSRNYTYDTAVGWQDPSGVKGTLGGAEFYDERTPFRTLAGKIEHLPTDEAMQDFYEMYRKLGRTGQVYVILDPEEVTHRQRLSMLATFADLQPIPNTSHGKHTAFFNFKEVIA